MTKESQRNCAWRSWYHQDNIKILNYAIKSFIKRSYKKRTFGISSIIMLADTLFK